MRRRGVRLGTFTSLQEAADETHRVIREGCVTALIPRPCQPRHGFLCATVAPGDGKIGADKITTEKKTVTQIGFWKRHLDEIRVGGSLFAALCCLGFPALVSILSAIGLGFLINDDILRPMMIVFLLLAIFGLALGMRHHGSPWALIVGIPSAVTLYVFIYVSFNEVIAGLGIAGLVIASLLNVLLRQRQLRNQPKRP